MEIITVTNKMNDCSRGWRASGRKIALVPTMGFFHEGHLSLMRQAKTMADHVVVSLFVNPLQFGPSEDLARYPRNLNQDVALAEMCGVDVIFAPTVSEMYPEPPLTMVTVTSLSGRLCGVSRPEHFAGVCTVVNKLFNIVRPGVAVFGSKDFQQLAVIRRMNADLNMGVDIVAHPIVRENDGLAMSSRNSYLSTAERGDAVCLCQAIGVARGLVAGGEVEVAHLLDEVNKVIKVRENVRVDYAAIVDAVKLEPQVQIGRDSLLVMAVWVGGTRLIDNAMLME